MDTKEIAAQISEIRSNINNFLIRELKRYTIEGLAPSHGAILHYLFTNKKMTMKDMAKAVRRDKSTLTALVCKLVSMGYVQKETVADDQRSVTIRLTPEGKKLEPVFREISDNLLQTIWRGIDEAEQKEVMRILKKIGTNVQ